MRENSKQLLDVGHFITVRIIISITDYDKSGFTGEKNG